MVSNGDLTLSLVEHSASVASITLTANTLTSSVGGHSVTLTNYSHKVDVSGTNTVIQMSATVETTSSRLGSSPTSYTISTPTPIRLDASGAYVSGSVLVTGNGSALLMTVTGTNTFQLQVDGNGDNVLHRLAPGEGYKKGCLRSTLSPAIEAGRILADFHARPGRVPIRRSARRGWWRRCSPRRAGSAA